MTNLSDTEGKMQAVMDALVQVYPGCAICLMVAPFGAAPDRRVNYIGNANRADMMAMMEEVIQRWKNLQ